MNFDCKLTVDQMNVGVLKLKMVLNYYDDLMIDYLQYIKLWWPNNNSLIYL